MKRSAFLTLAFTVTTVAAVLAGFAANRLLAQETLPPIQLERDTAPLDRTNKVRITSYADVLDRVTPAVVSVHVAHVSQRDPDQRSMENLLRRYYGMQPLPDGQQGDEYVQEGLGSGFVVTPDGYILTNNHVISGRRGSTTEEIIVQFSDGREFEATVIGSDPQTDVAVIKVDAPGEVFPHLPLGDSANLRVGDIVFAVGNPLRVGMTVTQGIVSALERTDLDIIGFGNSPALESFIQTDAAINRGNSGGPLVDAQGRVIGINTAIASPTGGSIGIGFAIPVNLAAKIMQSLVDDGEVRRGFIGVELAPLNRELAQAFGLPSTRGALINNVTPGLPGANAGLTHGDVVTTVNGQTVDSVREMIYLISSQAPGSTAELGIVRNGQSQDISVTLGDREQLLRGGPVSFTPPPKPKAPEPQIWELADGIEVSPLNRSIREAEGLPSDLDGLRVTRVAPDSPHGDVLPVGAVILSINGEPTTSVDDAQRALRMNQANALYIYLDGRKQYVPLIADEGEG
ncbi:MAG: Do family serine endopeptidase [Puniceicoccales bacterium]